MMKQKKLLLLGGIKFLLPVIKTAQQMGLFVITCDYLPNNIAHQYSDEYHNVSIIDKEAVLSLAQKLNIDGIMSFAVDPGVVTAAYVAEKMYLASPSYQSVKILQNKKLFRKFLSDNNFNTPKAKGYNNPDLALKEADEFVWPIIVKPVDSAGSKGVTKVENKEKLPSAINHAIDNSLSGEFIIEEFITQKGCSSSSECFSINNELQFVSYLSQRFSQKVANPYAPTGASWPSTISQKNQDELTSELQRLIKLLNLGTSIYNVETREDENGKAYLMEVSPRGGGNRLAEILHRATGVDLIKYSIQAAIGEKLLPIKQPKYNGYWAQLVLHSNEDGVFKALQLSEEIKKYTEEVDLWVKEGDKVPNFRGANDAIGHIVLHSEDKDSFERIIEEFDQHIKVELA